MGCHESDIHLHLAVSVNLHLSSCTPHLQLPAVMTWPPVTSLTSQFSSSHSDQDGVISDIYASSGRQSAAHFPPADSVDLLKETKRANNRVERISELLLLMPMPNKGRAQ
jgi:hypothetical protein